MEMRTRCEGVSSRVRELEVNNHALTARLKELQEQLDAQALQNRADMAKKDHEIDFLNEQHTALTEEPSYSRAEVRGRKRRRIQEEEELFTSSIVQEYTMPMEVFIEPLAEVRGRKRRRIQE